MPTAGVQFPVQVALVGLGRAGHFHLKSIAALGPNCVSYLRLIDLVHDFAVFVYIANMRTAPTASCVLDIYANDVRRERVYVLSR